MTGVDVLAVAAHPDDAEAGCGGVLALCARAGATVAIADLTAGELSTSGTPELRQEEASRAAELLGVSTRLALGLPDGRLGTDPAHRDAVVDLLRATRPRIVLAPFHVDDRHPDHAAAGRLVRDAAFLAGVGRYATARGGAGGGPHRPARVYHYAVHHAFVPSFVVDVTAVWEQRTAAVQAYASQFGGPESGRRTAIGGTGFLDVLTARAAVHGAAIGVARGEAFHCSGPVGLTGLPGLADPPAVPGAPPVYRAFL